MAVSAKWPEMNKTSYTGDFYDFLPHLPSLAWRSEKEPLTEATSKSSLRHM